MSDLLLAFHLAFYISLTHETVLLRQCFYTLVFLCLSNKDNYKTKHWRDFYSVLHSSVL